MQMLLVVQLLNRVASYWFSEQIPLQTMPNEAALFVWPCQSRRLRVYFIVSSSLLPSSRARISILCTSIGNRLIRMWPGPTSQFHLLFSGGNAHDGLRYTVALCVRAICTVNCLCGTFTGVCLMDHDDSHLSSSADTCDMFKIGIQ